MRFSGAHDLPLQAPESMPSVEAVPVCDLVFFLRVLCGELLFF